ncbi:MAG: DHH family phosphoesterase [Dysgonamonadaceae bacterium]
MEKNSALTAIIDTKDIDSILQYVQNSKRILITTHLSPDGDALGSSLSMYHFLKRMGKEVKLMVPNSFPYFLKWMPASNDILIYEYNPHAGQKIIKSADLIFILDYNAPKRIGDMGPFIEQSTAKKILIDHHLDPTDSCDVIVSIPKISSTSELIFRLLYQADEYDGITKVEAECIYCGMMTDTGSFTYGSSSPEIYYIISLLLRKGIDKDQIYSKVYNNFSADRFRLLGFTLSDRMKIFPELHTALLWLTKEDQERFNYNKGDTEGFVNYPLSIKGIIFSTFIREDEKLVKLSLRSQGEFPCNEFASNYFQGGGHLNASGGEHYGSLEEAIELFKKGIQDYAEKLKSNVRE